MQIDLNYLKRKKGLILLLFLFCFSLIVIRWQRVPMPAQIYEPRSGTYGDVWSCLNVQSAAHYFRDYGFVKSSGLPVFNYTGKGSEGNTYAYTHYPSLPDELAGVVATITGSIDTRVLSILPLMVSVFFFFLILRSLQAYNPDKTAAFIASALTLISCYFICWADDLHQHVYGEYCKWLFVWLLFRYYHLKEKRTRLMLPLAALALLNTWITFEHILYYAIVVAGFSMVFEKKLFTQVNVLLGLMTVLGIGLHVLQNYHYFGSWQAVMSDIQGAYTERTVGHADSVRIGANEIANLPSMLAKRLDRMYFIGVWPLISLGLLGFIKLWNTNRRLFGMGIVLLLASISWIFFMTQHVYIHLFTIRHFGLFQAFIISWGIYALFDYYRGFQNRKQVWGQAVCIIAALLCVLPAIESHFYYVYLKYGYLFPTLGLEHHLW